MPLPKRPSGGATPQNVAPPKFGKSGSDESNEPDLALPDLDDFTLPDLSYLEDPRRDSGNENSASKATAPDSLSPTNNTPKSINHFKPEPSKSAASDELDAFEDEDEETRLNRELGLLDDDDFVPVASSKIDPRGNEQHEDSRPDFVNPNPSSELGAQAEDPFDSILIGLEENPLAEESEEDDELANLLKDLEEIAASDDEAETTQDDDEQASETDSEETDWESALAELEANSEDYSLPIMPTDIIDDDADEDEEDDLTSYAQEMDDFVPPSNPFAIPENFVDPEEPEDDEDDEDEEESEQDEEEFIPPSDPFANPFADEEPTEDQTLADEEEAKPKKPKEKGLKDKVAAYPSKAKKGLKNYFAKINAELHGEEFSPQEEEDDESFGGQNSDEMDQGRPARGSNRSGLAIFGFLRPIKSLYTGIVNFIFGILTTVLGILSKLPLIGFIFKIALEATRVLRAIAQYIPLAFFIGGLVLTSYLSVARESVIALPDSGGATFNNFQYDSASNSASGTILNTGEIIADVQPTFQIKSIKPSANPVTWVIPETVATCEMNSVQVDIDNTMNVTAKCSEPITGFFPRATGELK